MEPSSPPTVTFESFSLRAEVLSALKALGYEEPTPIQRETIPALMSGRDVLGQAATGTGKTAAFALPMLEKVDPKDRKPFEVQALVLVPTRELAMQVAEAVQKYGSGLGVTSLAVYGGQEIFNQVRPLKRGVDIVIATPGRALDHIARKTLQLKNVKMVVLDEADEMLDMGFEEDLQSILNELPATRQTALFSATLPSRIAKIAERHLKNPVRVSIAARSVEAGTLPKIRQSAFVVQRKFKEAALMRVLEWETPQSAIVFCRTRTEVEALNHVLMRAGYEPAALHGGLTQEQRDQVLRRFKDGSVRVLVATDVAARGLHVEALSHVVNFDLPTSPEVYVHRIGRTGRAGKEGVALSFLDPREQRLLRNVEFQIKGKVPLEQVPTRAQLDSKRSETVAKQVQKALTDEAIAPFVELAKAAAGEGGLEAVAGAAMMLLQKKLYPPHDSDSVEFPKGGDDRKSRPASGDSRGARGERAPRDGERSRDARPPRDAHRAAGPREGMSTLSLTLGERAGLRPQDVVGAIANEAGVPSKMIQGVRIEELSTRVEVPTDMVHQVMEALHATRIRGRKVRVSVAGAEGTAPTFAPKEARAPRKEAPRDEVESAPPAPRFGVSLPESTEDDEQPVRASAPRASAPKASAPRVESASARASAPRKAPRASAPRAGDDALSSRPPRASAPKSSAADAKASAPRFGAAAPRSSAPRKPKGEGKPEGRRFGAPRPGDRFGGPRKERESFGGGSSFKKPSFGGDRGQRDFGNKDRFGSGERGSFQKREFGDRETGPAGGSFKKREFGDRDRGGAPGGSFKKREFGARDGGAPAGGSFKKRDFGDRDRGGAAGGPFKKREFKNDRFGSKPGTEPARFATPAAREADAPPAKDFERFGGKRAPSAGQTRFPPKHGRMAPRRK